MRTLARLGLAFLALGALACGGADEDDGVDSARVWQFLSQPVFEADGAILDRRPEPVAERQAFFGDLHVHTTNSFDAYAFGTLATPDDAYRYARGAAIPHPGGFDVQLRQPLDFYAVTDHALFLGVAPAAADTEHPFSRYEVAQPMHDLNAPDNMDLTSVLQRIGIFSSFLPSLVPAVREGKIPRAEVEAIIGSAWRDTIDAADRWNDPGRFTTFVAYEYTSSSDDRGNLHRNVIFEGSDRVPAIPFSRFHSQNPEGLWDWMDALREQGVESLAIPHNSNGSNGQMFKLEDWAGDPMDAAYTTQRIRNEPIVEITQVKGTSETHPALSSRDEWAGFEIMPFRVATNLPSEPAGSYVRDALRRGLALERAGVPNPYAFGVIGSSDTHTGATSDDESNFFAKLGILDSTPQLRGSVPLGLIPRLVLQFTAPEMSTVVGDESYLQTPSPTFGASGLAGLWAEENTRESLYAALRRKETFATSGPRIRLRFFAGYEYPEAMLEEEGVMTRAYESGVPMGADLAARPGESPRFLVWALADPAGTPLDRVQIVKGWIDAADETSEFVYDVACSDGVAVDPVTHRCADNGATVDLADCSTSPGSGATQLRVLWQDPDFDASERAFYYARVLENPTCRWSTWDALREGVPPRSDLATTIQERAWSSPIQVVPAG